MDIKSIIIANRLKQWEIAELMGISEFTLSRWLRKPEKLSDNQKQLINSAIKQLTNREAGHYEQ